MYTLYYLPDTCSLATLTILHMLEQPVELINRDAVADYQSINPTMQVPALDTGAAVLTEGAAILLYLLNSHPNRLLPEQGYERQRAIENIAFANASMHPAYGRLFFAQAHLHHAQAKQDFLNLAAVEINKLWQVVELRFGNQPYLGGREIAAADVLLAVYARWGDLFPVDITIGPKAQAMIADVLAGAAFAKALRQQEAL
ncbi:glutathione S-transferase family protein [Gilvimarinus sp. SDUM040013]|uniref:Glutathione S-transferase family protein n=1 Tax=Gilvimarinus gilvus TaxID=3058038 RepID=A0ABU4S685_9GAMM|nr:glutathione S-transferase family protein [Gilvimarinus sp. SDUM040013]MDO3384798.1 glutathione S-transferase family protein [Gilvimarinus sp. SDUM040013]MDX6850869.1 glutathione S-transferase family protein [Gilvimarinus sp. SDUM040013]